MAILPIGFFMPLPLAMMIPFMGMQSAVMMKQAGENWQYGKRLQSSLSNDEFNKQTQVSIFEKNQAEIRQMIPTMEQSIKDMRGFQDFIIVEMIELMRRGLETGLGAIFGLTPEQSNEFFGGTNPPSTSDPSLPPPDTTTELITLSITEIQALGTSVLQQILAFPAKYTDATIQHIKTEMVNRGIDEQTNTALEQIIIDLKRTSFEQEQKYLIFLTTTTFEMWRDGLFEASIMRPRLIKESLTFTNKKNRSATSDSQLDIHRASFLQARKQLIAILENNQTASIADAQFNVNMWHTVIWAHQLIFSI